MEKMYSISESRLIELLAAEMELNALEAGGVDNWCWCGDSISDEKDELAEEYGLERDGLMFDDIAKAMLERGEYGDPI